MIQIQVLSKILEEKSLVHLLNNQIDKSYFSEYVNEFEAIMNHYKQFDTIQTKETFLNLFPDFMFTDTTESWEYLIAKLREEKTFNEITDVLQDTIPMIEQDAILGVTELNRRVEQILQNKQTTAIDLISDVAMRKKEFTDKLNGVTSPILTGFKELDEKIQGWTQGDELVTIVGRTNQGKTWLALKFLTEAWKQGKRVGLYSGEMSANKIGFRFDTLQENLSNMNMLKGDPSTAKIYTDYLEMLKENKNPFIVVTPKELGRQATVSDIENLVRTYKLDILGIDQISLMTDERASKGEQTRIRLSHIAEDLVGISNKYSIPIIQLSQANRGTVKNEAPELENLSESDAIAQHSTKVVAMRQIESGLEISIIKNRYGTLGHTLSYFWDIDTGKFTFMGDGTEMSVQQKDRVRGRFEDTGRSF